MATHLDGQVSAFRSRPLDTGPYTFMWVDALTVKVREDGRVVNVHALLAAGYNYIFWLYQNPLDFLYVQIRVMLCGTVVLFISSYYGFTARGGPVGVGKATAKAMLMNLLFIRFVGVLCTSCSGASRQMRRSLIDRVPRHL